jgi:ABC-type uncharacterized transport system permease subunit
MSATIRQLCLRMRSLRFVVILPELLTEMIELIVTLVIMILLGIFINSIQYRNKERPQVGIKRNNVAEYLKDYWNLKAYLVSIILIVFPIIILIAILILEISFKDE